MEKSGLKSILRTVNLVLGILLVSYALYVGMTKVLPYQSPNLGQTSRSVFYHVPMWFAMMIMGYTSVVYSIMYLRKGNPRADVKAREAARLTVLFGLLESLFCCKSHSQVRRLRISCM